MKIKEIAIPIYRDVITLISGELSVVMTYLSGTYSENLESLDLDWGGASALCFVIHGNIYIWWEDEINVSTLGHEIIHATYNILQHKGVSIQDQEAVCYLWQYIMDKALAIIKPELVKDEQKN